MKKVIFRNTNKRKNFNRPFFKVLHILELRLKFFLLRLRFMPKLADSIRAIKSGLISVNGQSKKPNYILRIGDCIHSASKLKQRLIRTKKIKLRR